MLALDVDGVIVLDSEPEPPTVATTAHVASAYGRWRRDVLVPVDAPRILHELADRFECVWTSAWSHTAHVALREALLLPEQEWPWLGVQFGKVAAVRAYAAGRPWALIEEAIDPSGPTTECSDGLVVRTDPRRGIADVDPAELARLIGTV